MYLPRLKVLVYMVLYSCMLHWCNILYNLIKILLTNHTVQLATEAIETWIKSLNEYS